MLSILVPHTMGQRVSTESEGEGPTTYPTTPTQCVLVSEHSGR